MGANPGGSGVRGHLQVALECGGRPWRLGASPGALESIEASPGGSGVWGHKLLTNLLKLVKSPLGKIVHK